MHLSWRLPLRPAKRAVLKVLRHMPKPLVRFAPARRLEPSTKTWCYQQYDQSEANYKEVVPSSTVSRHAPRTYDEQLHWKFRQLLQQSYDPSFVVTLREGKVWGTNAEIIAEDGVLLSDLSRSSYAADRLWLGKPRHFEGRIAVLLTAWSNNYYHWMIDLVPRVELLRKSGYLPTVRGFLVPGSWLPFQAQTYAMLGISKESMITAEQSWTFYLEADELIVPSLPPVDSPPSWAIHFVRELGLQFKEMEPLQRRSRIFIDRQQSIGRRLENDSMVFAALARIGFERVCLEDLTIQKQMQLFSEADCVVGPHGAGLTNIVFCRPGTVIVDIFSPTWVNPCFWVISEELNLRYGYLIGEGERPPEGTDPRKQVDDILLDSRKLIALLKEQGIE